MNNTAAADWAQQEPTASIARQKAFARNTSWTPAPTFYGGGVAELPTPLTLLMNVTGIQTEWQMIQAPNAFFTCTKKLHNTLQGESVQLPDVEKDMLPAGRSRKRFKT